MTNRTKISLLFFSLFFLGLGFNAVAQLSPGDLIEKHKQLEGVKNCTECHSVGEGVTNKKCLACHSEISQLIQQKRGYHASREVNGKKCAECHNDHHGRKFEIIQFKEDVFDHTLAGYDLEGAHKKVECKDCHKSDHIEENKIAKRSGTFLGLDSECLSCHTDFHQETLPKKCLDCHDMEAFRPAPNFDHSKSDFKLTQKHSEVDCKECHAITEENGVDFQAFADVAYNKCTDCHEDQHNGQFGESCLDCHTGNSFAVLKTNLNFNHGQTQFALEGLHKNKTCKDCHSGKSYTNPESFNQCKDCHTDYHKSEFVEKNPTADCKDCHSVNLTFDYTTFSNEKHGKLDFPLNGAHLATPCFACHLKEDKWSFSKLGNACADCHGDEHETQISSEFYSKDKCKDCHSTAAWGSINFDHDTTGYELDGQHALAKCRACHFREEEPRPQAEKQKFYKPTNNCAHCHENNHEQQFEIDAKTDCRKCHSNSEKWTADKFEHNLTEFPLEGEHAKVDCSACHKSSTNSNNLPYIEYKIQKFKCIDCHS